MLDRWPDIHALVRQLDHVQEYMNEHGIETALVETFRELYGVYRAGGLIINRLKLTRKQGAKIFKTKCAQCHTMGK